MPAVKEEKITIEDGVESMAKEMVNIIKETRQATKDVFSALRLELIKSRDEVFKMKKGLELK